MIFDPEFDRPIYDLEGREGKVTLRQLDEHRRFGEITTASDPDPDLRTKRTMYYVPNPQCNIVVGRKAIVFIPAREKIAFTTQIIRYDPPSGEFETQNTIYKLEAIGQGT